MVNPSLGLLQTNFFLSEYVTSLWMYGFPFNTFYQWFELVSDFNPPGTIDANLWHNISHIFMFGGSTIDGKMNSGNYRFILLLFLIYF